jgi:hypothetical protein
MNESNHDDSQLQRSSRHYKRKRRRQDMYSSSDESESDGSRRRRRRKEKRQRRRRRDDMERDGSDSGADLHKRSKKKKKKSKHKKKQRKRRRDDSSSSSSESEDSRNASSRQDRRQEKKKRKMDSKSCRDGKLDNPDDKQEKSQVECWNAENTYLSVAPPPAAETPQEETGTNPAARRTRMAPMSREHYEAEQSKIREVYDEESGRYRLVRGSGEIIERIVSRSAHQQINQTATRGDGSSFSRSVFQASKHRR